MTIQMYGIPNCDTVKRARAWLAERDAEVRFHDFKKSGVPSAELSSWLAVLGREVLVNRKGTTWRKLTDAQRALAEADDSAKALMMEQPSVIKRPLVQWPDGRITAGFDPAQWAAWVAGHPGLPG
jgi:Spx/MgsR family transcriptional regulator